MSHAVFICYSSNDKKVADMLCDALESKNIICWIAPRDSSPGALYAGSIIDAINTAKILVLVFSSSSMQSPFVIGEVERAFSKKVLILTFRLENIPPSKDIELFVSSRHWLDAFTPPIEKHINHLVEVVMQILNKDASKVFITNNIKAISAGSETHSNLSNSKTFTADDYFNEGKNYYDNKNYDMALQAFEKAVKINPLSNIAWLYKGYAFKGLKQYKETLDTFNQAIELNPNFSYTWNAKGDVFWELKCYDEALAAYNQAIKLNPDYHIFWFNKGLVLKKLERYDEALEAYNQTLKLNPEYYTAWNEKGNVLSVLNRAKEAEAAFQTAKKMQEKK